MNREDISVTLSDYMVLLSIDLSDYTEVLYSLRSVIEVHSRNQCPCAIYFHTHLHTNVFLFNAKPSLYTLIYHKYTTGMLICRIYFNRT